MRNWAGNYVYRARCLHRPATLEQLQELVATAPQVQALGSRHSFTDIGDARELVTLDELPPEVAIDADAMTVSFGAGLRYGDLAAALGEHGLALANLASLPHISIAGACATASHGSGVRNGNLATTVAALELVTSKGELIRLTRANEDLAGAVVGLGALGVVRRITLDVEPSYEVRQRVFERMRWEALIEHFDEIMGAGYSVSVFSRWGEHVEQVWIKTRVSETPESVHDELFGARAATGERHPIVGLDPVHATPQGGVPGLWSDRLPHFRLGFTPSSGDELQSEYLMPRRHARSAIEVMLRLRSIVNPLTQVAEIRTVAADELWMSPAYGEDVVAFHFTWRPDTPSVTAALEQIEAALAPFQARPHWGKLFGLRAEQIAPLYPRLPDFRSLLDRFDPRGAFRNDWLRERVLGER